MSAHGDHGTTMPPQAPASGDVEALIGALGMPSGVRSDGESFVLLLFAPDDAPAAPA